MRRSEEKAIESPAMQLNGLKKDYQANLSNNIDAQDCQEKNEKKQNNTENSPSIQAAYEAIEQNVERWPSTLVARKAVDRFTGYAFSPKTLSNADARKRGPEGAFRFNGGPVCYPVESLAKWLKSQVQEV